MHVENTLSHAGFKARAIHRAPDAENSPASRLLENENIEWRRVDYSRMNDDARNWAFNRRRTWRTHEYHLPGMSPVEAQRERDSETRRKLGLAIPRASAALFAECPV